MVFMSAKISFYAPVCHEPPTELHIGDNHYEPHVVPDPSHPYIYHFGNVCAMPHWHENIEILYFHGKGGIICDRASYQVNEHDIAVFGSNILHAVPRCEGVTHDCLIVDGAFLSKCDINTSELKFDCVVRDKTVSELYRAVMGEIIRMRDGDEYGAAAVKVAILALVVQLCRNHSNRDNGERCHGDAVKRALGYIKSHYDEPLSIDRIAHSVNISKYHFCREFHRETGFTVIRYINNLRCREAQKLLHEGKYAVGEVARMCGYENMSYFTRTYKTIIGKTPTESRAGAGTDSVENSDKMGGCC